MDGHTDTDLYCGGPEYCPECVKEAMRAGLAAFGMSDAERPNYDRLWGGYIITPSGSSSKDERPAE